MQRLGALGRAVNWPQTSPLKSARDRDSCECNSLVLILLWPLYLLIAKYHRTSRPEPEPFA